MARFPFTEDLYVFGCILTALSALLVIALELAVAQPDVAHIWLSKHVVIGSAIVAVCCLLELSPSFRHSHSTRTLLPTLSVSTRGAAIGFAAAVIWNEATPSSKAPPRSLRAVAIDLPSLAHPDTLQTIQFLLGKTELDLPPTVSLPSDILTPSIYRNITDTRDDPAEFTQASTALPETTSLEAEADQAESSVIAKNLVLIEPMFPRYLDAAAAFAMYSISTSLLSVCVGFSKSDQLHGKGGVGVKREYTSCCRRLCCWGRCCARLGRLIFNVSLSLMTQISIALLIFAHIPDLAPTLVIDNQSFFGPPQAWGPLSLLDTARGLSALVGVLLLLCPRAKSLAFTHFLLVASLIAHALCAIISGWPLGLSGDWGEAFPRILTFEVSEVLTFLTLLVVLVHSRYVYRRFARGDKPPPAGVLPPDESPPVIIPMGSALSDRGASPDAPFSLKVNA